MACHHQSLKAHTIEKSKAWQADVALGKYIWSDEIEHRFPLWPLDRIHGWTMWDVECHNDPWNAQRYKRCEAWHAIITFGKKIKNKMLGVECHHRPRVHSCSNDVGVACHNNPFKTHTVGLHRVWLLLWPLDSKHDRMMSGIVFHHGP